MALRESVRIDFGSERMLRRVKTAKASGKDKWLADRWKKGSSERERGRVRKVR